MIDSNVIEKAVYDLCVQANTTLPKEVFNKLLNAYNSEENLSAKNALGLILQNAKMAYEKKMPLCQDTGQVLVFVRGKYFPDDLYKAVNNGVEKAYEETFFRKSVVEDAIFNRKNTQTNTPCIIYTEITDKEKIKIELLVKGGGSENVCSLKMLSPTSTEEEIIDYVVSVVEQAGSKGCPPYFIGIGIGGTMDYAALLSKKALLLKENIDEKHDKLAEKVMAAANNLKIGAAGFGGGATVLDVKILTSQTHIACMPVAVTMNCHSSRHVKCIIEANGKIKSDLVFDYFNLPEGLGSSRDYIKIHTSEISRLKSLEKGQNILLSGEIYTARDMAHKRLIEMIKKDEKLPFDLQDKIIFYTGPCPCEEPCVVGSIGPTTAARMDKYAPLLYEKGILATIGKGERSEKIEITVKQAGGLYFTVIGGIACLLSERFIKKGLVGFKDLGPEAIYRFEVDNLPLQVALV